MKKPFDSRPATREHIAAVHVLLHKIVSDLNRRAVLHDASKLREPELSTFNEFTPKLQDAQYGSPEYKRALAEMGEGLAHHYQANDHHPEHFERVEDMNLLQQLEMLADWKAAGQRPGGTNDLRASIATNTERYGIPVAMERQLLSTAEYLGWLES